MQAVRIDGSDRGRVLEASEGVTRDLAPKLLGAAFLTVIVTSLGGGVLLSSAAGSGGISEMLVNISNRVTLMRIGILADLATSLGIIALAVLLYVVLNKQGKILSLIALGCWFAEALALAFAKIGSAALIPLSQDFVHAGSPQGSYYQVLGDFLYKGIVLQLGSTTHMFFYCVGGILWYYLFFTSRYIPRVISLYGLAAVSVGLAGIVLEFLGSSVSIFVFLPILPFELAIGFWLVVKGINASASVRIT